VRRRQFFFALTTTHPPTLPSPEEIALQAGADIAAVRAPQADTLFAERALRLRELAAGHAMRDYLLLLALVSEAQHERARRYPQVRLPDAAQIDASAATGQPLLAATAWPREPLWRTELRALLAQVLQQLPGDSPARATVQAVIGLPDQALEQQADRLLAGITLGLDMAAAPLIAAGLQLYWAHLVAGTASAHPGLWRHLESRGTCPCCGSLPTSSIRRVGPGMKGQRYLHCTLCQTEWHMVQVMCTHCLGTQGIHYQALQALAAAAPTSERAAVEAETCDHCHHYLKLLHMEREPHADPVADDLATLTLDLLVSDAGFTRHGTNLLLLFGDAEAPPGER